MEQSINFEEEEKEKSDLTLRLVNLNLRNFLLCDDGMWALARQISGSNDILGDKDLNKAMKARHCCELMDYFWSNNCISNRLGIYSYVEWLI